MNHYSDAWEITDEDIAFVLRRHGVEPDAESGTLAEARAVLSENAIIRDLLREVTIEDQIAAANHGIEAQLMAGGLLPDSKSCFPRGAELTSSRP